MYRSLCIDASVYLSLLLGEPNAKQILTFLTTIKKLSIDVVAPSYLDVEVYSTIRNKEYNKNITSSRAVIIIENYLSLELTIHHLSRKLLSKAHKHSVQSKQPTIYDCIYSAFAEEQGAIFVTEDRSFLKKIRSIYPTSYSVEEVLKMKILRS